MKSIFSNRRNKSPHNNEEAEKQDASFFGKESKTPFFNSSTRTAVQTKLTVGQPGDKYEKEADSMADAVVNKTSKPAIQNKDISSIQRESLATPQEDEKLGTAEQRMEEDKLVQEKPEIQRMGEVEEEEGMVNKMEGEEEEGIVNKMEAPEEEEMVNKMDAEKEEEEPVQTKSNGASQTASSGVSQQIKSKAGKGKSLPKNTRAEMEASFGVDFSGVNVHTDQDAIKMNKELGAQAFTHGKDVYFNSGKYNPDSSEGKRLLAHELTHVVQQKGAKKIQMQRRGRRRRQSRQPQLRSYVVRDRQIGLGGAIYVSNLAVLKSRLMRTRNEEEWTLVVSIHGSQDRLAAQSPPNWQRNAIFYNAENINVLFSADSAWVNWRDRYGPTSLSLVSCQVSAGFEGVLINNLTRNGARRRLQSAQGLGAGCKPLAREASLDIHLRNRREYNAMNDQDQRTFRNQLIRLNQRFGYFGRSPVPDNQVLDFFFNEAPRARWIIVEVTHHGSPTGIPFWNRSTGSQASRFKRLCDQGVGRLRGRQSGVPPMRSN
ncbi:DUF4157 domain-containing protein [Zobellia sp. 1_MG-2023]|uniref:eCIS core domain-containing protein n=1 Tax=Zobellia sp. 1_MG-2023 TaxID=3062626 RepID=UPI0026E46DEE|nr:DUF4157 domain-containing protein [Zobellia sp. 1_MG-2023]MDO6818877.1 DUF4157 domain-containing protein [Zobellia sp. 1_MG-2023]